jgi:DNA-binding transcriptional ArsR family regulator
MTKSLPYNLDNAKLEVSQLIVKHEVVRMARSSSKSIRALPSPKVMARHADEAAGLLKALAHPARLLVLCQLVEGERSVGELQPITGLSMSALSQHLAVLREMALVETRRESQTIHYSLAEGPAASVLDALYAAYCGGQKARASRT